MTDLVAVGVAGGWCVVTYSATQIPPLTITSTSNARTMARPPRRRTRAGREPGVIGIEEGGIFPCMEACEGARPSVRRRVAREGHSVFRGAGAAGTVSVYDAVVGACFSGRGPCAGASRLPTTAGGGIAETRCSFVWPDELTLSISEAVAGGTTPTSETPLILADRESVGCTPAVASSAVANACTLA